MNEYETKLDIKNFSLYRTIDRQYTDDFIKSSRCVKKDENDDEVLFIDFSEDGYSRQNRKKSTQEVNLRDTDHAIARYDEVLALVLGKKPKTSYYTEANGKVIKDTITRNGDDWLFTQHQKINITPTEEDFKRTVANYLSFRVSQLMKGTV